MGNTEDYLDSLLNSINNSGRTGKGRGAEADSPMEDADEAFRRFEREQEYKREQRRRREEENRREKAFLEEFEGELEDEDADDFLKQYELELEEDDSEAGSSEDTDFFDSLDGIVSGASKQEEPQNPQNVPAKEQESPPPEESAFSGEPEENPLMPEAEGNPLMPEPEENPLMPEAEEGADQESSGEAEYAKEETADESEGDADLLSLLSGLDDDDEISGLDSLLEAGQEDDLSKAGLGDEKQGAGNQDEKRSDGGKKDGKKEKKAKKKGFFGKLSTVLFGDDEEEENTEPSKKEGTGNLSEEDQNIVKELEAAGKKGGADVSKEEKKKKKEEKKEKKKEKKEEKAEKKREKKERKEEKKKQKPPKPPKEADHTPPLPKKPMLLIFLLVFSLFIFVLLIMKTSGYSSQIAAANQAMDNGEYVEAYQELSGLELKEKDKKLYEKVNAMALVQSQYKAYLTLMGTKDYDMALDALIRGMKRCEKEAKTAKKYGLEKELNAQKEMLEQALKDQFGMSADEAEKLYEIRDREEYSIRIADIINKMNLGQDEE